jgi:CheY-like chemotaxis protein
MQTILIIDDTTMNIQLMQSVLADKYHVKAATSGARGIRVANREPRPALILLDIQMPEMNGFEVCEQLKSDDSTKGIPIVFLTGNDSEIERSRAVELGASDFLVRPVEPEEIYACLERLLPVHPGN